MEISRTSKLFPAISPGPFGNIFFYLKPLRLMACDIRPTLLVAHPVLYFQGIYCSQFIKITHFNYLNKCKTAFEMVVLTIVENLFKAVESIGDGANHQLAIFNEHYFTYSNCGFISINLSND